MKNRWILAFALLVAPLALKADMAQTDMDKAGMETPMATKDAAKARPAKKQRKVKKAAKKVKASKGEMGKMEMNKPKAQSASMVKEETASTAKSLAKHKKYYCTMDGYESDTPGKCPKCGMDLAERK